MYMLTHQSESTQKTKHEFSDVKKVLERQTLIGILHSHFFKVIKPRGSRLKTSWSLPHQ